MRQLGAPSSSGAFGGAAAAPNETSSAPAGQPQPASAHGGETPRPSIEVVRAILDDHLSWLPRWHMAVFFDLDELDRIDAELDARVKTPLAEREPVERDLMAQPAFQRLAETHQSLHKLARDMLFARGLGQAIRTSDYRSFCDLTTDFFAQLRRLERAFEAASAGIDPLTGLRNRNGMLAELEKEHERFLRTGQAYCLALCDLDRFKEINDTHGHHVGDRVLAKAAGVIVGQIRQFDDVYRQGGEEFLIVLKESWADQAMSVVDRVRRALAASPVRLDGEAALTISASFGLAEADRHATVSAVMSRADDMLYRAKQTGRNRISVWPAGQDRPSD